ncbi:MAG: phosphodiester glycosidase family protein [Bacilli bacterium]|nr:phosphodiester glycosidase family protein [Bacilli bacterium]
MKRIYQIMKKSFIVLLFLFILGFSYTSIKTKAANDASFSVSKTLVNKQLMYGVSYKSVEGISNTAGSTTQAKQVVAAIDIPSIEGLVVTSWADISPSKWNMSRVNKVAKDYESKHPGYKVIAAVNGDFYDINAERNFPRTPTGCEISDGNYFKSSPSRSSNYQVVSFTNDGSKNSIIAYNQKVVKVNSLPTLAIYDENNEIIANFSINKVNEAPGENEISVFYGTYDSNKKFVASTVSGDSTATFVIDDAIYCLPHSASDFYGLGYIKEDAPVSTDTNRFVLKSNNAEINEKLGNGVKVRVQYEWNGEASNVKDAVNAGTQILVNGAIASNANTGDGSRMSGRHPRTAIGIKENGNIVLLVNDGRQESIGRYGSYGDELAAMLKEFGCVNGFNLDGGGSSIMYYLDGDELVLGNKYSDASERSISNIVLVAVKEIEVELNFLEIGSRTVDVAVSVKDAGRHNISKLLVRADPKEAEVIDGVAHLTSLSMLTRYDLKVVYISGNGKTVTTTLSFPFATTAKEYKIKGLSVDKSGDKYKVTLNYNDSGESTTLGSAKITINGKEYQLVNGSVEIDKGDFTTIHELIVTFNVRTIDGMTEVSLINPHAKFLNDLKESFTEYKNLLDNIY